MVLGYKPLYDSSHFERCDNSVKTSLLNMRKISKNRTCSSNTKNITTCKISVAGVFEFLQ